MIIVFLFGLVTAADVDTNVVTPATTASLSLVATVPCGSIRCPISKGCGNPSCSCCGICTQQFCGTTPTPSVSFCTTCGASCSRNGLAFGICNKNLKCVVRGLVPPNCGSGGSCVCGSSCTMSYGGSGVCQTDGTCAVNILPPNCGIIRCPLPPCPYIPACLPPNVLENKPLSNGCPGCAQCVPPDNACTSDSACTNGFCYQSKCYPFSGVGETCGGFIVNGPAKRCGAGLRCQMNANIPDLPGTCVRMCVCPMIRCPIQPLASLSATVNAAPSTPTSAVVRADVSASAFSDLTIACPPCPKC